MHLLLWFSLFCILTTWSRAETKITYSDVLATNKACPPKDTCSSKSRHLFSPKNNTKNTLTQRQLSKGEVTNCFCDSLCVKYNDCCVDYPGELSKQQSGQYECRTPINQLTSYQMISSCPSSVKTTTLKQLCETNSDVKADPFLNVPVSNVVSKTSYKNVYCAQCHSDFDLNFWKVELKCNKRTSLITNSTILKYLKYNNVSGTWIPKDGRLFPGLSCTYTVQEPFAGVSRLCKPHVSNCPSSWTNKTVEGFCHSYTAYIYLSSTVYKNPHCAICNYIDLKTVSCFPPASFPTFLPVLGVATFQDISYSLLLDYFYPDGNQAGKNSCPSYQMYDSFSGQCRPFSCGRFAQAVGGNCVPL